MLSSTKTQKSPFVVVSNLKEETVTSLSKVSIQSQLYSGIPKGKIIKWKTGVLHTQTRKGTYFSFHKGAAQKKRQLHLHSQTLLGLFCVLFPQLLGILKLSQCRSMLYAICKQLKRAGSNSPVRDYH